MELDGKAVLITGGSRGIGLEAARLFLSRGARVAIGGVQPDNVARAVDELGGGARVASVVADVSTADGCARTVAAAADAFDGLDVLFANAGNYDSAGVEDVTEDAWDRTMAVHLKGTFFCVQAALPWLRAARGAVVTMGSDAGLRGLRGGWAAYCAAKGGVVNLTRQLALDLAPEVRVNCVAPGPVATDHLFADLAADTYGGVETSGDPAKALADTLPTRKLITPAEVADAVVFLATNESLTGSVLSLDGGSTAGLP
jgi:NAD(P)-dependent dehydrogenase (short-subunit alcohol dehydrogenase family)